jgi:hypothetical protein
MTQDVMTTNSLASHSAVHVLEEVLHLIISIFVHYCSIYNTFHHKHIFYVSVHPAMVRQVNTSTTAMAILCTNPYAPTARVSRVRR